MNEKLAEKVDKIYELLKKGCEEVKEEERP